MKEKAHPVTFTIGITEILFISHNTSKTFKTFKYNLYLRNTKLIITPIVN